MKRHAELQDLSREHHGALKLARDARRAAQSGQADAIQRQAQRIVAAFAMELEPHFCTEERGLLVFLAAAGRNPLVQRTLAEHREMRALVADLRQPEAPTLRRFADLLEAHVRFEERELFEAAQALMTAAGTATPAAGGPVT